MVDAERRCSEMEVRCCELEQRRGESERRAVTLETPAYPLPQNPGVSPLVVRLNSKTQADAESRRDAAEGSSRDALARLEVAERGAREAARPPRDSRHSAF